MAVAAVPVGQVWGVVGAVRRSGRRLSMGPALVQTCAAKEDASSVWRGVAEIRLVVWAAFSAELAGVAAPV